MVQIWYKLNLYSMQKIERKIHSIDAKGRALGRIASEVAVLLMGKHRPDYVPHHDMGDIVEITNIQGATFSGNKIEQKMYYRHSMYPGGLKTTQLKHLWEKNPSEVLRKSVSRMLPKNKLRIERMKRLIIKN
ncbi:50S ribosomal protein L13 [Candidatus Uhrbacteria bacterium RIFOXYA2_FULL_40_9]|nr:MAG: 50S ribosomal protein L13 [Candidatus Uhrbacteria bacterium RIFOXYA2_FULL_40_9]OGL97247.1 MAG: 50S ribosomal protein L13 [Candidatus Uhrbacteria bacterium RIFOXYB2_FULL_41_18]HBK34446.1 50S ribosomal protein L13 [Candidatus Uhrbacteria bacterium]HCB55411.1 50S ribosomal protein L13 [Candidatus Uhrbacteria bacterium]